MSIYRKMIAATLLVAGWLCVMLFLRHLLIELPDIDKLQSYTPPLATTLYASLAGALLLGLAALVQGDIAPAEWSWRIWASMLFLALFAGLNYVALNHAWRFDIVLLSPGRFPRHIRDAWRAEN